MSAYDPVTGRSRRLRSLPAPRAEHVAVWTGQHLLVWGGVSAHGSDPGPGLVYDLTHDAWSVLPRAPFGGRTSALGAWTGTQLVVWGGFAVGGTGNELSVDGAIYTPAT